MNTKLILILSIGVFFWTMIGRTQGTSPCPIVRDLLDDSDSTSLPKLLRDLREHGFIVANIHASQADGHASNPKLKFKKIGDDPKQFASSAIEAMQSAGILVVSKERRITAVEKNADRQELRDILNKQIQDFTIDSSTAMVATKELFKHLDLVCLGIGLAKESKGKVFTLNIREKTLEEALFVIAEAGGFKGWTIVVPLNSDRTLRFDGLAVEYRP